ncbi:secreted RxLR effector protein 161-like [Nicotiana tomentosiformis]|uniref:secreted RxLR effector protein 161-like n=1 Tax=Nicotiana tomentosiformis TaxID=4098 RepID=UPI00388CC1E5
MEDAKAIDTPMSPTIVLDEDSNGKLVDETMYRRMIGSLLYLTASRPDIMFSVYKCARFQSAPKESHLSAIKRIIRYLIGTSELGLWYDHSNNFSLRGFSDDDFAGDKIDRKSTSGTCQLLGNALVSWHINKQNYVALSTTEAEYLAVRSCCT